MNDAERRRWKEGARKRLEPFIRSQVATCERILGPELDRTRPEQLEEVRRGIKDAARAYFAIMEDPVSEEEFALSLEVFDEILDAVVRTAVH